MSGKLLRAGTVGRPHGLDGSFYVADAVAALLGAGARVLVGQRERRVLSRAGTDLRPIVRLEGCEDRDCARSLGGQELLVARGAAPQLDGDEWWADDLEGCAIRDGERVIGRVRRLLALPSCEALEVERADGLADLLVPFVHDAVREVDLETRAIDVDLRFLGEA